MLIGYARISTQDQTLNLQQDALTKAGCAKLFTDTASGAKAERKGLDEALNSYQLRERGLRDRDNRHLLKVLRRYHQRGELLRFLEEPLVEPTNNRVERALRPAVIARKVSQCSKNQAGAYAFSAFKSVIQTLVKRDAGSLVEALYALFRSPKAPLVPG